MHPINSNPSPGFFYPFFNVKDNWMVETTPDSSIRIRNLTDIANFRDPNYIYDIFLELQGDLIFYPVFDADKIIFPYINTSEFDELFLDIMSRTPVHNPEYVGYYSTAEITFALMDPGLFHFYYKILCRDNYLFIKGTDESDENAIHIIDITNASQPERAAQFKDSKLEILDFEIYEDFMITSVYDKENIRIVDISDKREPIPLNNSYSTQLTHSCPLIVKDNLLFVYYGNIISVFDLTNIPNLELLYKIQLASIENNSLQRVVFYENYLLAIRSSFISIFDLSHPENTTISEITFTPPGFNGYYFGVVDNNYLYVSFYSEIKETTLAIYDLSDINHPNLVYPFEYTTTISTKLTTLITPLILINTFLIYYQKKRKR